MIENVIAMRYARALAELAAEQEAFDQTRDDLNLLADLLDPDRGELEESDLRDFLGSPTVPLAEKIKVTDVLCEKLQIGKLVSDFLNVLIRRYRILLTGRIAREFVKIASRLESIQTAHVESARLLGEEQINRLTQALETATGSKVRLEARVREDLLGGARIRIGDKLVDGTIAARLKRLSARLG